MGAATQECLKLGPEASVTKYDTTPQECSCPAWRFRPDSRPCKHVRALRTALEVVNEWRPETCAFCTEHVNVYFLAGRLICTDHLAAAVSLASNDVWPHAVSYSKEIEDLLLW